MSVRSFKRDQQNQGFTPYQSQFDHQISQFSKLNLNSQRSLDRPLRISQTLSSSDLLSIRSRKRKGSFQLKSKQSNQGLDLQSHTFLNKSLVGKSSLNRSIYRRQLYQMNLQFQQNQHDHFANGNSNQYQHSNDQEMQYQVQLNKQFSQRSCPVNGTGNIQIQQQKEDDLIQQQNDQKSKRLPNISMSCIKQRPNLQSKQKGFQKTKDASTIKQFIRSKQRKSSSQLQKDQKQQLNYDDLKGRFHKTKNLLRNLSTYLHRYILYNIKSKKIIEKYFYQRFSKEDVDKNMSQFSQWVKKLSMNNFQEYQQTWSLFNNDKFGSLYRQLSYIYYVKQAYCDIHHSRLSKQTKDMAYRYLYQFLEGLECPGRFTRFK